MDINAIAKRLPQNAIGKDEIFEIALTENMALKKSSIFWVINKMLETGLLIKVGRNKYCANQSCRAKRSYEYEFSEDLQEIVKVVSEEFPLMEFQVWEAIQFNYFVNHQIAHNTFFIEVETMLENAVYEFLKERFGHNVLLKPNLEICTIYAEGGTMIVQNLISEASVNRKCPHGVLLEKLFVDMMVDKLVTMFVSPGEFADIYENAFAAYVIDESKFFRYARRRNAEKKIRDFIHENTKIKLYMED